MLIYIICGILIFGIIAQIISAVIEKKEGASISGMFFVRQFFAITAVLCFGIVSGFLTLHKSYTKAFRGG